MYSSQRRVRETQAMQSWAKEELKDAKLARSFAEVPSAGSLVNLADKRLNKRLIKIVENLASQPHASVPQEAW